MKVKITGTYGSINSGDIVDIDLLSMPFVSVKDKDGTLWSIYPPDYEFIEDEKKEEVKNHNVTLKDILGQDVKTIEFR